MKHDEYCWAWIDGQLEITDLGHLSLLGQPGDNEEGTTVDVSHIPRGNMGVCGRSFLVGYYRTPEMPFPPERVYEAIVNSILNSRWADSEVIWRPLNDLW